MDFPLLATTLLEHQIKLRFVREGVTIASLICLKLSLNFALMKF